MPIVLRYNDNRMSWTKHEARMEGIKNAYKITVGKHEGETIVRRCT